MANGSKMMVGTCSCSMYKPVSKAMLVTNLCGYKMIVASNLKSQISKYMYMQQNSHVSESSN